MALPAVTASLTNTIVMEESGSVADIQFFSVTPDSLKPDECDPITVDAVLTGSGNIDGTSSSELILAESPDSVVTGGEGDDCIVIGEGSGSVDGGSNAPNTDVDICIGGPSTVFINCETEYRI